jgi:hypothetical protein
VRHSLVILMLGAGVVWGHAQTNTGTITVKPQQDVGAAINAAFLACGGSAAHAADSCVVALPPGANYVYSTTIVIPTSAPLDAAVAQQVYGGASNEPFVTEPILDCNGSTLNYGGRGDAFTVLGENHYKSGEIRNCNFGVSTPRSSANPNGTTQDSSAATATIWGRLDFTVRHSTFAMGRSGVAYVNDKAHGGPGYTEENHWDDIQINVPAGGCGLTFRQDPSIEHHPEIGSYFYNTWTGFHFDLNGNGDRAAKAICLPDSGAEPVGLVGNTWIVHVNNGGDKDAVFWLGAAATVSRGMVVIHGEADSPSHSAYDVFATVQSSGFQNWGESYATGFRHGYGQGVAKGNVTFEGGPSVIQNDLFPKGAMGIESETHEVGGVHPGRICKFDNAGSVAVELADFHDQGVNCFFEIGYRETDGTWLDVDEAGKSGKPFTSILWTDSWSHNVGLGPGFGAASVPKSTVEVRGTLTAATAVVALHTPASSHEACTPGQFADDANYHYVCVAANTWKRVALTAF